MTQCASLIRWQVTCWKRTGCTCKSDRREVAYRTVIRSHDVRRWCIRLVNWCDTGERQPVTMTLRAVVHDAHMIHRCAGEVGELACRVAGLASQCGWNMIDRFRYWYHTCEHLSVVAGVASAHDAGMVHRCAGEVVEFARRVTGLTDQRGRQVVARFGYRRHTEEYLAVVTCYASTGNTCVVHHTRTRTRACWMAQRTRLGRRKMVGWQG